MKILFSPSESKISSQILKERTDFLSHIRIPFQKREYFLENYLKILTQEDDEKITQLFGSKKIDLDLLKNCQKINYAQTHLAIELYNGVAYRALDFEGLDEEAKDYILQSVYIFSNLFGVVAAQDRLPFYKVNQNFKHSLLNIKSIYEAIKPELDQLLCQEEMAIDLRAEIYAKVYPLACRHIVPIFLKNGKKLSHFSKYYRGIFLRHLALLQVKDFKKISQLEFPLLKLIDIRKKDESEEYFYEICAE